MGRAWPLTGRAEEMQFIEGALRRKSGPRGVVLAGAAGVGKTRLARETMAGAARRGHAVWWVPATASARTLPFGAFAGLFDVAGDDAGQVLQRATAALTGGRGAGEVVIVVDDAHQLDEMSALLVHHLAVRCAAAVVVTLRSDELAPDAITALWKDRYLDRLEVQPLSEEETAMLLESVLGGQVDSVTAGRLFDLSRGCALYLRQLVDGALEAGRLRQDGGVWRWEGPSMVPQGLTELLETRMGTLPESVQEVVDLLAFGEPLPVTALSRLTAPAAVEQAETRGVISVSGDDDALQARLGHPLYGEVRRLRTGRLRAAQLRGRLAQALGDTDDGGSFLLRRAVLTLDSDLPGDSELFVAAADRAFALCDFDLAARLFRAVVVAGGETESHARLLVALAQCNAATEFEHEAATLAGRVTTDFERVQIAVSRAINLYWNLGRTDAAAITLDGIEEQARTAGLTSVLDALRAAFFSGLGQFEEAIAVGQSALGHAELPDSSVVLAGWGVMAGLGNLGRVDEIGPWAERAHQAAAREPLVRMLRPTLALVEMHVLGVGGYAHQAENVTRTRRDESWQSPGFGQWTATALFGCAALARGRVITAQRRLRDALGGFGSIQHAAWRNICRLNLAHALALSGQPVAAAQELSLLESQRDIYSTVFAPELLIVRARVAAAEGTVSAAIALAHDAAHIAAEARQSAYEVYALHTAVCLGDHTVALRLSELASTVQGPRASAAAAQAAALAASNGPGLLVVSEEFEQRGDLLAATESAAQAAGVFFRQQLRGSAHAAATRAHRLAEDCEGLRTPALLEADRPLPLTGRQREIATLVAHGLSNQQIADRLTMSVRTVEGHIYRAATKLGVTSRTELAALIRDEGPEG
ncbi:MAG: LuxR C-terminal-related transcriptional regulator [Rhodococcus sp. (in: high G+C Gram-positive bacteria)]